MITALILAAGRSIRMGEPKQLLEIGGRSLLARVIAAAQASRCDDVLVVVGDQADRIGRVAAFSGARVTVNSRYTDGMGTSLAAGIKALAPECEAVIVLLADQPRLRASDINVLIEAYRSSGRPIVATRSGEVLGTPTLFARPLFAEAAALSGDTGGRPLIERHPELVAEVASGSEAARWDVDTPEDFERVRLTLEKEEGGAPPSGAPPRRDRSASSG